MTFLDSDEDRLRKYHISEKKTPISCAINHFRRRAAAMSGSDDADDAPPTFVRLEDENSEDEAEWEDPSDNGVLSQVLRTCGESGGDASALEALLTALSVSLDSKGAEGDTPLQTACLYGHTDLVRVLLAYGATVAVEDNDGGTPLHDAAAGGYLDTVDLLIMWFQTQPTQTGAAFADDELLCLVNKQDGDGETPLHVATRGGHVEVVELLLRHGADKTIKSEAGLAARDFSVEASEMDATLRVRV